MTVPAEFAIAYTELRQRYPIRVEPSRASNGLALLQAIAKLRGGELLSPHYQDSNTLYALRCREGHEWRASGNHLVRGTWCPVCQRIASAQRQYPADALAQIQAIAQTRGGECLSAAYAGRNGKLHFRCAQGHEWHTQAQSIIAGCWCPRCDAENKSRRYTLADGLERLQRAAGERGGACLSAEYHGTQARYDFRCQHGHEWRTTGCRILFGHWCPQCRRINRRLGIEAMQTLAQERGGQCLSEHYVSSISKLEWRCHRGHSWWAIPGNVIRGSWCPECARLEKLSNRRNLQTRLKTSAVSGDSTRY